MPHLQTKTALALSALTLLPVGVLVTLFPTTLYALNGVLLDPSAAMMSEIRAPGVVILLGGLLALGGLVRRSLEAPALMVSAGLLLSYGAGRLISFPLDGVPPVSLAAAAAVELGLGGWCAFLFKGAPTAARSAA